MCHWTMLMLMLMVTTVTTATETTKKFMDLSNSSFVLACIRLGILLLWIRLRFCIHRIIAIPHLYGENNADSTCEISSKSLVIFHARSMRDFDEREKTRKKKTCRSFSAGRWENSSLSRLHARIVDVRQIYFFRVKQTMRERDFGASSAMFVCGGGAEKCRLCRMTRFQAEWNELRKRCGVRNQLILVDHDKQ